MKRFHFIKLAVLKNTKQNGVAGSLALAKQLAAN